MFEKEAAEITRKFGVQNPETTVGYRLILTALRAAYNRGAADYQPAQICSACGKLAGWCICGALYTTSVGN